MDIANLIERYREDHTHPMNRLTHTIGIPMIVASVLILPWHWQLAAALFVVGWILQFIGHAFEGRPPSFFRDPRFLLAGVGWFLQKVTGHDGGRDRERERAHSKD